MKSIAYIITKAIEAPDWSYMIDNDYDTATEILGIEAYSEDTYKDCGMFWETAIRVASEKSISMKLDACEREELDNELRK